MKTKQLKWLEFLGGESSDSWFSFQLIKEFDKQLKPQFENYFQRPMKWDRLWFFVEPSDEKYYLRYKETEEGIKKTYLKSQIRFAQMGIDCTISWRSKKINQFIHPSTKNLPDDLEIILEWIDDSKKKDKFPGLEFKPEMNK